MSNLIKSSSYVSLDEIRKLESVLKPFRHDSAEASPHPEADAQEKVILEEARELARRKVEEAEASAAEIIAAAEAKARQLTDAAKQEADEYWDNMRSRDEELRQQLREEGYAAGFEEGKLEAEQKVKEQYENTIAEAAGIIAQAHEIRRQTISDSEPFLLELSCSIAAKLIGRQLELEPGWIAGMIRQALLRCTDKGSVALCVAPSQFAYVQSMREELSAILDAQAELQILPDASVRDHGCVIKTSFGSVDARVETGLAEIKQALLELYMRGEHADDE